MSRASAANEQTVSLPIVEHNGYSGIAPSKNAPRRAWVLAIVHLLLLAHIGLWLLSKKYGWFGGKTLSPIEPSESMQTIELGYVNAGFIIFALALLSTLIFGRFFCGWGCHILLLQDFCGWIMKKLGVRPKPFRSRLLIWVPLLVALYMFVWPTFKRLALFPLMKNFLPQEWAATAFSFFKPVAQWGGFQNHLMTEHFWTNPDTGVTFPIIMAIPTLIIVGFAAVYFLGSKGFCTYGCPYGGFFAPLDEFAPGKIRVTDDCEQCGHCTARCTSNVRVHEEVREFGMVIDSGCMKCMDCISVCPNDALYYGFGMPTTKAVRQAKAEKKKPKKQYDLSFREDIAVVVAFLFFLFGWRELYLWEGVPFLMAVGLAGILAFCAFKSWRLFSKKHSIVKVQNLKLKWRGKIRLVGWIVLMGTLLATAIAVQNIVVKWNRRQANVIEAKMPQVSMADAFSPFNAEIVDDTTRAMATDAIVHHKRTLGWRDGGVALVTNPQAFAQLTNLSIVAGNFDDAEKWLTRFGNRVGLSDQLAADVIRLMVLQGRNKEAFEKSRSTLTQYPEWEQVKQLHDVLQDAPR